MAGSDIDWYFLFVCSLEQVCLFVFREMEYSILSAAAVKKKHTLVLKTQASVRKLVTQSVPYQLPSLRVQR